MAISKFITTEGMLNYPSDANPTTESQYQDMVRNWGETFQNLLGAISIWQPETTYKEGAVILSPNMDNSLVAVVTQAGTTGLTEPQWDAIDTTVLDGAVKYVMANKAMKTATKDEVLAGAINDKVVTPKTFIEAIKNVLGVKDGEDTDLYTVLLNKIKSSGAIVIDKDDTDKSMTITTKLVSENNHLVLPDGAEMWVE